MRQFGSETYLGLKATFRSLVTACGGRNRVAGITRGSTGRLSEAMDPHNPERFPAVDQIADLEADCGQPMMTQLLAAMAGYALVPLVAGRPAERGLADHMVAIITETGDVEKLLAASMADGQLSEPEWRALQAQITEATAALNRLMAVKPASRGKRT